MSTGFPEGEDVYLETQEGYVPPKLFAWPELQSQAQAQVVEADEDVDEEKLTDVADLMRLPSDSIDRGSIRIGFEDTLRAHASRALRKVRPKAKKLESITKDFGATVREAYQSKANDLRARIHGLVPAPDWFECGLYATSVAAIWTQPGVTKRLISGDWWQVDLPKPLQSAPVIVEFADGQFGALTAIRDMLATALHDEGGVSAVMYRPYYNRAGIAAGAEDAIYNMELGGLRVAAIANLAVQLRMEKHIDPVMGAISAYLYDSIGDIGNVRRMAYYYAEHGQPIPYDIALIAELRPAVRDGEIWVDVPEVKKRKPRPGDEEQHEWTHEATRAARGPVAGLWPWLRQGWAFLEDESPEAIPLVRPDITNLRRHLRPGRFTTFDATGGRQLINLLNLQKD